MTLFGSKKGQFYIFVALVLVSFAFTINRPAVAEAEPDSFRLLYENFIEESPIVVNNAIYDRQNVSASFKAFADSYSDYAKTRSPDFRLLYLLKDEDSLLIGNNLGTAVGVNTSSAATLNDGETLTIQPQDVTIVVDGIDYSFQPGPQAYRVSALFREKTGDERKVFVKN